MKAAFEKLGLRNVRVDAVGNVLGERPGRRARPHVLVAAHLDTVVFPEGTDLTVKRDGSILRGPGIGDNCRGVAVLVGIARAMQEAPLETEGSVTFVANVGERRRGISSGPGTCSRPSWRDASTVSFPSTGPAPASSTSGWARAGTG